MNTYTKLTTFDTDELSDEVRSKAEANAYKKAAQAIREYRHMTMRIDLANRILERVHGIITGNMPVYLYGYDDNKVNLGTIPSQEVPKNGIVIKETNGGYMVIQKTGKTFDAINQWDEYRMIWSPKRRYFDEGRPFPMLATEQVVDTGVKING